MPTATARASRRGGGGAVVAVAVAAAAVTRAAAARAAATAEVACVQSSSAGDRWRQLPAAPWGNDFPADADVTVNRSMTYQTILGFGAALTESAAWNFASLNASQRDAVLDAYYGPAGLGYTLGRVPMNSPDFALASFNEDNVTGDTPLAYFDDRVERDRMFMIPFITAALARVPLKLYLSPWSPPPWMKTNGNMIGSLDPCLLPSPAVHAAWAAYFPKFIAAYAAAGVPFWGLTPQNEPLTDTWDTYEACMWTAQEQRDFIATYLGPAVKAAYPDIKIMIYDHNKILAYNYSSVVLANATAAAYVDGVAVHWYDYGTSLAVDSLAQIHAAAPAAFILGTEACWIGQVTHTWYVAAFYALDVLADLNYWAVGWVDWNALLDTTGGPNHVNRTDIGAPLLVDAATGGLIFQPSYYTFGHITRFVPPGAVRVNATGAGVAVTGTQLDAVAAYLVAGAVGVPVPPLSLVAAAFVTPDGANTSVVVLNAAPTAATFKLRDVAPDGTVRALAATIPGNAIQTYTYAN